MTFAVGDYMLLAIRHLSLRVTGSGKLKPLFVGPYRVTGTVGENAYHLDLPASFTRIHPVFNVSQLKRYRGSVIPPPDPVEIDGLVEYKVDKIIAHQRTGRRKRLEFLVSFVGYDAA